MKNLFDKYAVLKIGLFAALVYIPFLGSVRLFDWDEINFAECAREMLVTKNYLILQMNYLPFWEKPPFFIWLSALSMKLFGVNEFAARLPDAVCGITTLIILYKIGHRLFNKRLALLWVLCYGASTLAIIYFKSGIIDPWFNLFIFLGVYYFGLLTLENDRMRRKELWHYSLLSGLFIGLAILTKGPVALIIYVGCTGIYFLAKRFKNMVSLSQLLIIMATILLVGGVWFLLLILVGKQEIIWQFISYQRHLFETEDSGHGGPFYYHLLVLLFGFFPASVFALGAFRKTNLESDKQQHFKRIMLYLFWFVLILFSIVKTKILHYSSLCYFPLSFLAALYLENVIGGKLALKKWIVILAGIIGSVFGLALIALPLVDIYKNDIITNGWVNDDFTRENLKATVQWTGFDYLIGILCIATTIFSLIHLKRKNYFEGILFMFLGNILVVVLAGTVLASRIEQYSQAAAIDFYRSKQNEDCYVSALGYHSYAQYFYSRRKPEKDPKRNTVDWMLRGKIDKPAYFVAKISNVEEHKKMNPQLQEIGRKNGYIFLKRDVIP